MRKNIIVLLLTLILAVCLSGCSLQNEISKEHPDATTEGALQNNQDTNVEEITANATEVDYSAQEEQEFTKEELIDAIYIALNNVRVQNGIGEFVVNDILAAGCDVRVQELPILWGHERPEGDIFSLYEGLTTDTVYANEILERLSEIENLYISTETEPMCTAKDWANEIVEAWMNSDLHRPVILAEESKVGVSVLIYNEHTMYVCAHIGHIEAK